MFIGKLCEEFHEKIGKDKNVKIVVESKDGNTVTTNIYSNIKSIPTEKESECEHTLNAKTLLTPTISYLARILELNQTDGDKEEIDLYERMYKKSFKFPLKHKTLLYP